VDEAYSEFTDEVAEAYDRYTARLNLNDLDQSVRYTTIQQACEVIEDKFAELEEMYDLVTGVPCDVSLEKEIFKTYVLEMIGKYLEAVKEDVEGNENSQTI
jgi:hypothetical protein